MPVARGRLLILLFLPLFGCDCSDSLTRVAALIRVEPALDFGEAAPGTRVDRKLAIKNPGNRPLIIAVLVISGGPFELDQSAPLQVPPGRSIDLTLTYVAQQERSRHEGRLMIDSDADDSARAAVVLLTGATIAHHVNNTNDAGVADAPDAAIADAGTPAACRVAFCDNGWCWDSPLPQGGTITDLWGSGPNDIWATAGTTLLHYDGVEWHASTVPQPAQGCGSLFGFGADDIWGSCGMAMHFDGNTFAHETSSTRHLQSYAMWGTSSHDLWSAGPKFHHYNGTAWTEVGLTPQLFGLHFRKIYGFATNNIWAVGNAIARYDGTTWSATTIDPEYYRALWGAAPDDVWLGGRGGKLIHWNGASYFESSIASVAAINDIHGTASDDVWFASTGGSYHWDGAAISASGAPADIEHISVWASARDDVWLGGVGGSLLHYDGDNFSEYSCGVRGLFLDVWASSPTDIWAIGIRNSHSENYPSILAHSDGTNWQTVQVGGLGHLDLFGLARDNIYAVGLTHVSHYDGTTWSNLSGLPPDTLWTAIWGSAPDDIWVAGTNAAVDKGVLVHFNGTRWTPHTILPRAITEMHGSSANDIWAVGFGMLLHYDGAAWTEVLSPIAGPINDVYVGGPNFAVAGTGDALLMWNGTAWTRSIEGSFNAIWGSDIGNIWAVGGGTVAHYDGEEWTLLHESGRPELATMPYTLFGIHGTGPDQVWAVGPNAIVRYRP